MHVCAGTEELQQEEAGLGFGETAATSQKIHQGAVGAELQCHVNVGGIFETVLKGDDVRVVQGLVYADLSIELPKN